MKLYTAHFIRVKETLDGSLEVHEVSSTEYFLTSSLFLASDAEQAFSIAQSWLPGYGDVTHDQAGNLVRYFSPGLFELEEMSVSPERLLSAANEIYGVDVGHLNFPQASETPVAKQKHELEVFAVYRAQQTNPADA